jgi:hypothetical protein
MKGNAIISAVILGFIALLATAPLSVSSDGAGFDSLNASYDGTQVKIAGSMQGDIEGIYVEIAGPETEERHSWWIFDIGADGMFSYSWTTELEDGRYGVTARAYSEKGNVSQTVYFDVSAPPHTPGPTAYNVVLVSGTGYTISPAAGAFSPVASGGSYSFTVSLADGYDPSTLRVMVNGAAITADNGVYTITNITGARTVTAEVSMRMHEVSLPSGEGFTVAAADGYSTDIPHGGTFSFTVAFEDPNSEMEVRANGTLLGSGRGTYTVTNVTEHIEITVGELFGSEPKGDDSILIIAAAAAVIVAVALVAWTALRPKV